MKRRRTDNNGVEDCNLEERVERVQRVCVNLMSSFLISLSLPHLSFRKKSLFTLETAQGNGVSWYNLLRRMNSV